MLTFGLRRTAPDPVLLAGVECEGQAFSLHRADRVAEQRGRPLSVQAVGVEGRDRHTPRYDAGVRVASRAVAPGALEGVQPPGGDPAPILLLAHPTAASTARSMTAWC